MMGEAELLERREQALCVVNILKDIGEITGESCREVFEFGYSEY